MDPQERLFLQCVYETLEDAGYTRHSFGQGRRNSDWAAAVGVYVGVNCMRSSTSFLEHRKRFMEGPSLSGDCLPLSPTGYPIFVIFHGPSMAVDTMCSSHYTAIHLACESLVRGNCDAAIAGGVNVSIHPNKYLFLSQGQVCFQ